MSLPVVLRRSVAAPLLLAALLVAALIVPSTTAAAAPAWAPAGTATIHPGVQTVTDGGQCTANFIFTHGTDVLIGQAAHCAGTGGATETNGCDAASLPLGTPVEIEGASQPGTLVYSSWRAMQAAGEPNANACAYNDLALVRIDPADVGKVNPSVPFWGGPEGLDTDGTQTGDQVYSYGNSSLRLGISQLSPKVGTSVGTAGGGWTHDVYTATPGIPGDSGSAFLSADGSALGTLSTLQIAPLVGSNGVSDLSREIGYAQNHGMSGLTLEPGTEPFQTPVG